MPDKDKQVRGPYPPKAGVKGGGPVNPNKKKSTPLLADKEKARPPTPDKNKQVAGPYSPNCGAKGKDFTKKKSVQGSKMFKERKALPEKERQALLKKSKANSVPSKAGSGKKSPFSPGGHPQSTFYLLKKAVENVKPSLQVRKKKIRGRLRHIPYVLSEKKRETIGIRWIIESARKKKKGCNKPFFFCLGEELIESFQKKGEARQKRDALHKLAESNRGFLRYRWW